MTEPRSGDDRCIQRNSACVTVVIPVYNEAETVCAVVRSALAQPEVQEIIVVDDGSRDSTWEALQPILAEDFRVQALRHPQNRGKGAALRTGFAKAVAPIVIVQDADLELDPAELASLVQPILRHETGVVYGSRFLNGTPSGAPWATVAANRFLTGLTNVLYRSRLTDMETCYKVMRIDVARSLSLEANRFDIEPEITAKLLCSGQRIVELPVKVYDAAAQAYGLYGRQMPYCFLRGEQPRAAEAARAGEQVINLQAGAIKESFPPPVGRNYKCKVVDDVGSILSQDAAFPERSHDERDIALLKVAHPSMHELRAAA